MSWNRPQAEVKPKVKTGGGVSAAVRFVVVAILLAVAAVVIYIFTVKDGTALPKDDGVKPKAIKNVAPVVTNRPNNAKLIRRNRRPESVQNLTASIGPLPDKSMFDGKPPRRYGEINGKNLFPRPLFKTREENHIAGLIRAEPGSRCLLSGFMPGEEERYLASLDVPVEFEDIDTPEEREMKEYMIELKKELKERVAAGEKITDIVQEARDELNAQANMKDKILQKFVMLQKEGSPEEIMQYFKEANGILAEYGVSNCKFRLKFSCHV